MDLTLSFLGPGHFLQFGSVCQAWRGAYKAKSGSITMSHTWLSTPALLKEAMNEGYVVTLDTLKAAADANHIETLEWLLELGPPRCAIPDEVTAALIRSGRLDLLRHIG